MKSTTRSARVAEFRHDFLALTGHLQHTFTGTPEQTRNAGAEFRDVTSFGLAAELATTEATAILLQTEWETSTLRDFQLSRAADPQWLIWIGLRTRLAERVALEMGFAEDIASFISPDFSAYLGLVMTLGGD